jgi:hypothetical protein
MNAKEVKSQACLTSVFDKSELSSPGSVSFFSLPKLFTSEIGLISTKEQSKAILVIGCGGL